MINYIKGDATYPQGPGPKVIVHCVNDIGKWGSGFVLALDKRWKKPGQRYRRWAQEPDFGLGQVQFVQVANDLWVANLVGQHRTIREEPVPIRYMAFETGFKQVADFCLTNKASAHMCRLGSGLARGRWHLIERIIHDSLVTKNITVTVYDL